MAETPDPTPMGPDDLASIDEWGSVGFDLALESEAHQAMLEAHRAHPDDEELYADYLKAKARCEVAWLSHGQAKP
jgi:hypothetical protein